MTRRRRNMRPPIKDITPLYCRHRRDGWSFRSSARHRQIIIEADDAVVQSPRTSLTQPPAPDGVGSAAADERFHIAPDL